MKKNKMGYKMLKSTYLVIFVAVLFGCAESYKVENITFTGYYKWTPTTSRRDDLFCPEYCVDDDEPSECCACNALPCWKIDAGVCGVKVEELYIEYTDPFGNATLVAMDKQNTTLYQLNHTDGRLTSIPDNICSFAESLVEIDLRNNKIVDMGAIKCLKMLDTLKLDHNKISQIPNGTFSEMEKLRNLSMTHSNFLDLKPFDTALKQGNIFTVDFSYNSFREVDITNILRPGEFCHINFEASEIETQTNIANYVLEKNTIHGPGTIDFTGSKGNTWLNFSSLGVPHYSEISKYLAMSLKWDNSSVHCDCNIVPFLRDTGSQASRYWPNLEFDFICETPEEMKGVNLTTLYHNSDYEDLVCNIEVCPSGCSCTDKQFQNKVVVKCNGLSKFPDFMPVGHWGNINVELDLDGNGITELPNHDYLSRVSVLNLKGNALSHLDPDAISKLKGVTMDMTDSVIEHLPDTFYNLNPDNINFGEKPVVCDCNNLWIGDWIRTKGSNSLKTYLRCLTSKGVVKASLVTTDFLNCPEPTTPLPTITWILVAVILILVVAAILTYYFRYELFLLKRRATFKHNEEVLNANEYGVFLSFSEENEEVLKWVDNSLRPFLDGYSCFVPLRNIIFGNKRNEAAGVAIKHSRNFVVVLCKEYLHDENSCYEFDTIWKYFSMDSKKQLIVINYDHFESSEISDNRLRAFTRINYDLNYKDRETKLQSRLGKRLGQRSRRRAGRHETSVMRPSNNFGIEPVTPQELLLPAVLERGRRERQAMRYQVHTEKVHASKIHGAASLKSPEILPNTPMRDQLVPPLPSKTRFRNVSAHEIVVSVPEKK